MEDFAAMLARVAPVFFLGALVAAVAVPACGSSDDSSSTSSAGGGGTSGSGGAASGRGGSSGASTTAGNSGTSSSAPVACGTNTCKPATLSISTSSSYEIPACCSDDKSGQCGLDSSFLAMFGPTFDVTCQPLAQPGAVDKACPNSTPSAIPNMPALTISFQGCCRGNGTCGYLLDNIDGLPTLHLGLGCVDSTPFLDGGSPAECGNAGGAGGESATGGEPAAGGSAGN